MEKSETNSENPQPNILRAYMYKCRICGQIQEGSTGYFSIIDACIILNELTTSESVYKAGASVSRTDLHNCEDGSLGIADLIGVQNVNK